MPGSALGEVQSHRQGGLSGWMRWQLESLGEIAVDVTVAKESSCSEDPGRHRSVLMNAREGTSADGEDSFGREKRRDCLCLSV